MLVPILSLAFLAPVDAQGDGKERAEEAVHGEWTLDVDKFLADMSAKDPDFQAMPEDQRKAQLDQMRAAMSASFTFSKDLIVAKMTMGPNVQENKAAFRVTGREGSVWEVETQEEGEELVEEGQVVWHGDDEIELTIYEKAEGDDEPEVKMVMYLKRKK